MTTASIQHLNWVDYSIVGIIVVSALISLVRGFVREAISLATWIIAVWVAIRFSPLLVKALASQIETPSLRSIIAFVVLFLAVLIIGGLINYLFSQLVERTGLSGTDRILGLIFGIARGVLLIGVLVLLGNMTDLPKDPWWSKSQLIPQFQGLAQWLHGFVPKEINQLSEAFLDKSSTQVR